VGLLVALFEPGVEALEYLVGGPQVPRLQAFAESRAVADLEIADVGLQEKEVVVKFIRMMTQVILHSSFRSRSVQRQR